MSDLKDTKELIEWLDGWFKFYVDEPTDNMNAVLGILKERDAAGTYDKVQALKAHLQVAREALEFYADSKNFTQESAIYLDYEKGDYELMDIDRVAREALEEHKQREK